MLQSIASILKSPSHLLTQKFNYNRLVRIPRLERAQQPSDIAPGLPSILLAVDIKSLNDDCLLHESGDMQVYIAPSQQIPFIMQEIGRLREITFRAIGEGTGNASDIDAYDNHYRQLFIWNKKTHEIIGGYRLGLTDKILQQQGKKGLYCHSLFKINSAFFNAYPDAIELGRSFVRPEYQRSFLPLKLLWKAILQFVYNNPKYCILFGPVSISNDYSENSQDVMIDYLKRNCSNPALNKLVKPRLAYKASKKNTDRLSCMQNLKLEDVSTLIASFEGSNKGMPVLIRQYLKLSGELLGFNRDPNFGNCIDGFIRVDLRQTEEKNLAKYMGKEQAHYYKKSLQSGFKYIN